MANIAKRPDGRWRARYRDRHSKEIARHFERKVDAQRWLDDVTAAVSTGLYVDPAKSRITVGEWAQKWLDTKTNLKPTTRRDTKACCMLTSGRAGVTSGSSMFSTRT